MLERSLIAVCILLAWANPGSALAQKIQKSPEKQIAEASPEDVDKFMEYMAHLVNQSAPIETDSETTILRALYLQSVRIFSYSVVLSAPIAAQDSARNMKSLFCSGRTNQVLMDKGISFQYSVKTPADSYIITFSKGDC